MCYALIKQIDTTKLAFSISYFFALLMQIFIPCYFGAVVLFKSHLITQNIYKSNWIDQNEKYKKVFRIFVERTFHPVQFSAGRVFPLDLGSFLSVRRIKIKISLL